MLLRGLLLSGIMVLGRTTLPVSVGPRFSCLLNNSSMRNEWGGLYGYVVRNSDGSIIDTLLTHTHIQYTSYPEESYKLKNPISITEYVAKLLTEQQELINAETEQLTNALIQTQTLDNRDLAKQRERAKFVNDSLQKIGDERISKLNEQMAKQQEIDKWKYRTDRLTANLYEPTSAIKTKTFKSKLGIDITYSYYMKDGEEVYHGKYTATHIYRDYKFWGGSNYGFIHLNGIEIFECTYRNGVMHGQYKYNRDVRQDSTWGNEHNLKHYIVVNIWNGFLDGKFHFIVDDFIYDGFAKNGILENITVTKSSNSHSESFTSNMNGDRTKPYILSFEDEFSSAFYGL